MKDTITGIPELDKTLGFNDLPHDSCQKCGKVFDNNEIKKYGLNKPVLCYNCMDDRNKLDNDIADICITKL